MTQASTVIRPSNIWYLVGVVILIGGVVLAGWIIGSGAAGIKQDGEPLKGNSSVQLTEAGPYSVYVVRMASDRMDAAATKAWNAAESANVTVRDAETGNELAVRKVYESTELQETLMARLVEFDVPSPGRYVVTITPSLQALRPSVKPTVPVEEFNKQVMQLVVNLFVGLGIGVLAGIVGVVVAVITLVRRSGCKKRLAAAGTN